MDESVFSIKLNFDLEEGYLRELPERIDKVSNNILGSIQNFVKTLIFGTQAVASELEDAEQYKFKIPDPKSPIGPFPDRADPSKFLDENPKFELLLDVGGAAAGAIPNTPGGSTIYKTGFILGVHALDEAKHGPVTDLEKLQNYQQLLLDQIRATEKALEELAIRGGNRPDLKAENGLPLNKEFLEKRFNALRQAFDTLDIMRRMLNDEKFLIADESNPITPKLGRNMFESDPTPFAPSQRSAMRDISFGTINAQSVEELEAIMRLMNLYTGTTAENISKYNVTVFEGLNKNTELIEGQTDAFMKQGMTVENVSSGLGNYNKLNETNSNTLGQVKEKTDAITASMENAGMSADDIKVSADNASEAIAGIGDSIPDENVLTELFTVPENASSEIAEGIKQSVENVEVPEVPLGFQFDLNEVEKIIPPELLERLNAAEVITPELEREIQEAIERYQQLGGEIGNAAEAQIQFTQTSGTTAEKVDELGNKVGVAAENTDELTERTENASTTLDGLGDLATDFAGNIENAFSATLTSALSGDFDSIKDIWKRTLDSMFSIFTDFAADVISKPIKVFFDQVINGKSTSGGSGTQTTSESENAQSLTTGQKIGVAELTNEELIEDDYRMAA